MEKWREREKDPLKRKHERWNEEIPVFCDPILISTLVVMCLHEC